MSLSPQELSEFKVVIPARLSSTRLPNKPLADIAGLPMIIHTWRQAVVAVGDENVVVATDSERVASVVKRHGGAAVLTSAHHESGTDRVCEVAEQLGWKEEQIVINVQGDEPLIPPALIAKTGQLLKTHKKADMATLAHPIRRIDDIKSSDVVKVVLSGSHKALYFSRAPIPHIRDKEDQTQLRASGEVKFYRHIGLYAYRVSCLKHVTNLAVSMTEKAEKLEQLRALEADMTIQVGVVENAPPHGVDTEEDLHNVRKILQAES